MIAAYAIALQALFSAVTAPALAASDAGFTICSPGGSDAGVPAQPRDHDSCLACVSGHCASASGCDRDASLIAWPAAVTVAMSAIRQAAPFAPAPDTGPHFARAPPAA